MGYLGLVSLALADGYVPMSPCDDMMGIHYVNLALALDMVVNELQPEILLYAPTDQRPKLIGVEYLTVAIGTTDFVNFGPRFDMALPDGWVWVTPAPSLYGTVMDEPMAPHDLGMGFVLESVEFDVEKAFQSAQC